MPSVDNIAMSTHTPLPIPVSSPWRTFWIASAAALQMLLGLATAALSLQVKTRPLAVSAAAAKEAL